MAVNKRKKVSRYRGSKTHGGGSMKKRRGAGHRGGRGMAGGGKRADQKKPTFLKLYGNDYFGKHGFVKKNARVIKATTLSYLNRKADILVEKKLAMKKGDVYQINLKDLGFNKLLGSGALSKKLNITADYVSKKAIEKIEKLGGKVEVLLGGDEEWKDVPQESSEEKKKEQ